MSERRVASLIARLACTLLLVALAGGKLLAQQVSHTATPNQPDSRSTAAHHISISWQRVRGAIHYEVLIRPFGGDVTVDQTTDAASIEANLPPGTYQVRVISYDIFDKPASRSQWRTIEVIRVARPTVDRLIHRPLFSGLASQSLIVEGKDFLPETVADLMHGGRVVARGRTIRVTGRRLTVHFDLSTVQPGTYRLRLSNPDNFVLLMKGTIRVRKRTRPSLTSLSLSRGFNDRVYRGVEVVGTGFSAATTFYLRDAAAVIAVHHTVVRSDSRALIDINLGGAKPGRYRLVASNPGGLRAQLEDAVIVENISRPEFVSMSPTSFTIGSTSGVFTLTTKDLVQGAQIFLKSGTTLIPAVSLVHGTSAPRTYRIDLTSVTPGTYDLLIRNTRFLTAIVPHLVTVKPRRIPRITASSLTHAYNTISYPTVVLSGSNMKPRFRVVLKRGTVLHELDTRYVSSRRLDVAMDFRGMAPGNYKVLLQDSGHVVASLPGGITVTLPPEPFVHPTSYRLLLGYPFQLVLSQSFTTAVKSSYAGGGFAAAFPVGVKFFPSTPGLRDTGLRVALGYSQFAGASNVTLGVTKAGFDLYYRTPFNFPLNAIVRAGYGATLTDYSVASNSGTLHGTTFNFYYDVGLAAELDVGKHLTFEAGATWSSILYPTVNLDTLAFSVGSGVRLGG